MIKHLISTFVMAVAFLFCIAAFPFHTFAQETSPVKAARLLNESKVKFSKIAENIWTVPFNGKSFKNFDVVISTDKTGLFMFVVVAKGTEYKPSEGLFDSLLVQNTEMDRVKIGIDKDDREILIRIDLTIRLVDKREFMENMDQLAAASDQIYAIVQPHLIKPN